MLVKVFSRPFAFNVRSLPLFTSLSLLLGESLTVLFPYLGIVLFLALLPRTSVVLLLLYPPNSVTLTCCLKIWLILTVLRSLLSPSVTFTGLPHGARLTFLILIGRLLTLIRRSLMMCPILPSASPLLVWMFLYPVFVTPLLHSSSICLFPCPLAQSLLSWLQSLMFSFDTMTPALLLRNGLLGFNQDDLRLLPRIFLLYSQRLL